RWWPVLPCPSRWTPPRCWPVLPRLSRWTPPRWWPVLAARAAVYRPRLSLRPPPRAGIRSPSPDGPQSPLRSDAATIPVAPAPLLAVFCPGSRRLPSRRRTTGPPPSSTSRSASTGGRFSGVHQWPVLGVHRGFGESTQSTPERRVIKKNAKGLGGQILWVSLKFKAKVSKDAHSGYSARKPPRIRRYGTGHRASH